MWLLPLDSVTYFLLFLSIFLITNILYVNKELVFSKNRILLFFFLFTYLCVISLPLFGHSFEWGRIFHFAALFPIIFFPNLILYNIFKFFRKLLIFFSFFSIILFILILIGIKLPYYKIEGFTLPMQTNHDYYRLYGFIVSSTNTLWQYHGIIIARACGPFLEPGHFGIYIGIIISLEKILYNKINKILLITGFLTFSPAFLIILFFIEIYNFFILHKTKLLKYFFYATLVILSFTILVGSAFRQKIWHIAVERHLDKGLNSRLLEKTLIAYNEFIKTSDIITGIGLKNLEGIGVMSDFRGLIFKFGLIGLILTLLICFSILIRSKFKQLFLIVPIILLIYLHRSWMFEGPYMYIFILFFTLDFEPQKSELNN